MSIEQPEETLSSNNLGTEIWETNSSGNRQTQLCVKFLFFFVSFYYKTETLISYHYCNLKLFREHICSLLHIAGYSFVVLLDMIAQILN